MPNKKINQLDSRVLSATDLILIGDPTTGTSFKSLVSGLGLVYVPYTGATGSVNLGAFSLTANSIIKSGGTSSQFLKANGSVDSSVYVPTTRTITINGTTLDLSADRTYTVSGTNIYTADGTLTGDRTIGTTAGYTLTISPKTTFNFSGSAGIPEQTNALIGTLFTQTFSATASNVLVYGVDISPTFNTAGGAYLTAAALRIGNTTGYGILQSNSSVISLFNGRVDVGGASTGAIAKLEVLATALRGIRVMGNDPTNGGVVIGSSLGNTFAFIAGITNQTQNGFTFRNLTTNTDIYAIHNTGNVHIGGTTDAGFKLDVNGTARVSGATRFENAVEFRSTNGNNKFTIAANTGWNTSISTGSFGGAGFRFGDGAFGNLLIGQTGDSFGTGAMLDLRCNSLGLYLNRGTISTMPNITSWGGVTISIVGGTGYTNGAYNGVAATGNYSGTVVVNVTVSGNIVTSINLFGGGSKIQLGETFTIPAASIGGTGSGMSFTITAINNQNPAFTFYDTTSNLLTYWDGRNYASPIVSKLDRVLVGGSEIANASSILELSSTTKGFLPPRMTTTQINAIASPAEGLMAYNTTISHMCVYQAGAWAKLSHSPM